MRLLEVSELVEVLRRAHGITETRDGAIRARLKHLQQLGVPKSDPPGRGGRTTYSVDDLMMLATVFELIEVGVSSALAALVTVAGWGVIVAPLGGACRDGRDVALIEIIPREARGIGRSAAATARSAAGAPSVTALKGRTYRPAAGREALSAAAIILDPLAMVKRIRTAVGASTFRDRQGILDALDDWRPTAA